MKTIIKVISLLFGVFFLFMVAGTVYNTFRPETILADAIRNKDPLPILELAPIDADLMVNNKPAVFAVMDKNNYEILKAALIANINLDITYEYKGINTTPGFYARYRKLAESEKALAELENEFINEQIKWAQAKLDEEFHQAMTSTVNKDEELLKKK